MFNKKNSECSLIHDSMYLNHVITSPEKVSCLVKVPAALSKHYTVFHSFVVFIVLFLFIHYMSVYLHAACVRSAKSKLRWLWSKYYFPPYKTTPSFIIRFHADRWKISFDFNCNHYIGEHATGHIFHTQFKD